MPTSVQVAEMFRHSAMGSGDLVKPLLNVVGLVVVAFLMWLLKNTPWAATSFIAYLLFLVAEGVLARRLEGTAKSFRATPSTSAASHYAPRAQQPGSWTSSEAFNSTASRHPSTSYSGIFGALIFGFGFLLLADTAVGLRWFDFDSAGQPSWLAVAKRFAEGASFLIMFVGPILLGFFLSVELSEKWSQNGNRERLGTMGSILGWALGIASYSHLALAPIFFWPHCWGYLGGQNSKENHVLSVPS